VLAGLAALSWLVVKFGDLPSVMYRVDARLVTIDFPQAPGIQPNAAVFFCGYPVGRVTAVAPPRLSPDPARPALESYRVEVQVALGASYQVPRNAVPKVFQRGLGGSYIQFVLPDGQPPAAALLAHGDRLQGTQGGGGEFISESTQRKLDELAGSLKRLSDQLQSQLAPLPPEAVDQSDPNLVRANVTTAVMRLDTALKHLNTIVGDPQNQRNIRQGLQEFAALAAEARETMRAIDAFAADATNLLGRTSQAITKVETYAGQVNQNFEQVAAQMQSSADAFAKAMDRLEELLGKMSEGQGTVGRLVNDPRLYETLVDALQNLQATLRDFRQQLALWRQYGITHKGVPAGGE